MRKGFIILVSLSILMVFYFLYFFGETRQLNADRKDISKPAKVKLIAPFNDSNDELAKGTLEGI